MQDRPPSRQQQGQIHQRRRQRQHTALLIVAAICVGILVIFLAEYVIVPSLLLSSDLSHGGYGGSILMNQHLQAFQLTTQQQSSFPKRPKLPPESIQRQQLQQQQVIVDGTFNGAPVTLKHAPLVSMAHCIGENYQPKEAWMGRSCHFTKFCFDTNTSEFVLFESLQEYNFSQLLQPHLRGDGDDTNNNNNNNNKKNDPSKATRNVADGLKISSIIRSGGNSNNHDTDSFPFVSLGGINLKWGASGIPRLKWFPTVRTAPSFHDSYYYELPPGHVLVPFHSLNGANPGHLVWDDFLPLYTLLEMFDLVDNSNNLNNKWLLMRYILPGPQRGLWASCDWRAEKTRQCYHMMNKFLPLLLGRGGNNATTGTATTIQWSTTRNFEFTTTEAVETRKSHLVCAPHGVAGLGGLTDHGYYKTHGWLKRDYKLVHNYGRGTQLRRFREFCLRNVGLLPKRHDDHAFVVLPPKKPHRIVFSVNSSSISGRVEYFWTQRKLLQQYFQNNHSNYPHVQVEAYEFSKLSLHEQLEIAMNTSIFISMCGGATVTAMFLPPGASVILYYGLGREGKSHQNSELIPILLDWDLFNSMTHVRVHWMPKRHMTEPVHKNAFVQLIQHELSIMEQFQDSFVVGAK